MNQLQLGSPDKMVQPSHALAEFNLRRRSRSITSDSPSPLPTHGKEKIIWTFASLTINLGTPATELVVVPPTSTHTTPHDYIPAQSSSSLDESGEYMLV